jgi:type II secretory ATPase GspE/PulE/Tfp pilus assembly ATPase PilB-like protein/putative methionine-R-sulfoxide reductase with GAF domain
MAPKQATPQNSKQDLQGSLEYQTRLNRIYKIIHEAESFVKVLPEVEKQMLALLKAERLTVYQRRRHDREIVSRHMTGKDIKEIRVPLSPSSIAGYVAMSQQPVRIDDVYDKKALKAIHPQLSFDDSFDRRSGWQSRSMVVVPIKAKETLLGILQIINRPDGTGFTDMDLKHAQELAAVIAQKFQYDFRATQGPFAYLLHRKVLTQEKLDELKKESARGHKSIAYLLITELKLTPEEVGESLERYYQVPFFKYDPDMQVPRDLFKNLNLSYLKSSCWVPVAGNREKVVVLIDDPNDFNRIMEIEQFLNAQSYEFRVGIKEDILAYLGEGLAMVSDGPEGADLDSLVGRLEGDEGLETEEDVAEGPAGGGFNENDAPVIQLVNKLIVEATSLNASDIHVEPSKGKSPAVVRMRVDGACRKVLQIPASHIRAVIARIKILSKLDIAERRKPQDGKIAAKFKGKTIELRVATIPTVNGESAVLRVLAAGDALPFDKLNLSKRNAEETLKLISHPHGIFMVVGPTGSGKTTTLHAILGHINTPDRKIWTAEDPVEITQAGLQQVQTKADIGFTFAAALRAFLRADPDVILIGEMRDQETSHIGVEASLTGHLVFSTLHTNSAPETITRLLGLELEPMDFADALLGVLAQRLVRTLCKDCKEAYKPSDQELEQLSHIYDYPERFQKTIDDLGGKDKITLYKANGCDKCGKSGYRGRTGIHELLTATPEMKKLIAKSATIAEIRDLAIQQGMTTLTQDGIEKILKGQTDIAQLRAVTAGG